MSLNTSDPPVALPKPGNATVSPLYRWTGWALTQWQELEFWCGTLYLSLLPRVNGEFDYPALKKFEACMGFRRRADLLEEVQQIYRPEQLRESILSKLLAEGRLLSDRRNDIAHGTVRKLNFKRIFREGPNAGKTLLEEGLFLVPISDLERRLGERPTRPFSAYNSSEIRAYGYAFKSLQTRIWRFVQDVNTAEA